LSYCAADLLSQQVITLLSDLGVRDTSATIARAMLSQAVPGAVIIDISHNVAQYDLQQAAYLLLSSYTHFPAGTVHIVLVDVFAHSAPRMLLAEKDGYRFIAPDNGILPLAFGTTLQSTLLCAELQKPHSFPHWMNDTGKVIAQLQAGKTDFPACEIKKAPRVLQPRPLPNGVECNILYVDRYENIVLDITRAQFEEMVKGRPFKVKLINEDDITAISSSYNDVAKDEPLCRFNRAGYLEIAFNHAPAASLLGFGSFSTGNLRYQTIKIEF